MLSTCDRHDDSVVVYDTRNCPICDVVDKLTEEVNSLKEEVADQKEYITQLETQNG